MEKAKVQAANPVKLNGAWRKEQSKLLRKARGSPALLRVFLFAVPVWLHPFSTPLCHSAKAAGELQSSIEEDEQVIFFPTFACLDERNAVWMINVHGWIYEPEKDSLARRTSLGLFRRFLGLDDELPETEVFRQRAWPFLVDNERGKRILIRLGEDVYDAGTSHANGHFERTIPAPCHVMDGLLDRKGRNDGWLRFEAVTRPGDTRRFPGSVQMIGSTGFSVISDIDDTIKISDVADRKALLRNTFLRELQPVPGTAERYARWAESGASFHYVSTSPWQLYGPLSSFLQSNNFPRGSVHLRFFRWKDSTAFNLLEAPKAFKLQAVEAIVTRFPRREFILVGDSSEQDPEVYGTLAREHSRQVLRIFIRDVTGQTADQPRYQQAFAGLPREKWQIFREAADLEFEIPQRRDGLPPGR
jgi:hypothetical protein